MPRSWLYILVDLTLLAGSVFLTRLTRNTLRMNGELNFGQALSFRRFRILIYFGVVMFVPTVVVSVDSNLNILQAIVLTLMFGSWVKTIQLSHKVGTIINE